MTACSTAAVLVVEDHADTAAMIVRMLRKRGIDAHSVPDGSSALKTIARTRPRVVIIDQTMPDLTGLEVLRQLKQDPATADADTQVIFYSASFDWDLRKKAEDLGAAAWMVKGVTRLTDLLDKVADLTHA